MAIVINGSTNVIGGVAVGGLPDGIVDTDMLAANAVATAKIADDAVTAAKSTGLGITVADIWRINTGGTLGTDATTDFNSNWERADTFGSGQIGSGMTNSSGVFTFPSTGIYLITAMMMFKRNSGDNRYADLQLKITTDGGSSYDVASTGAASFAQDYSTNTAVCNYIFDVTNVSTHKVFFSAYTNRSSVLFLANSTSNACSFTFIKLGDT